MYVRIHDLRNAVSRVHLYVYQIVTPRNAAPSNSNVTRWPREIQERLENNDVRYKGVSSREF